MTAPAAITKKSEHCGLRVAEIGVVRWWSFKLSKPRGWIQSLSCTKKSSSPEKESFVTNICVLTCVMHHLDAGANLSKAGKGSCSLPEFREEAWCYTSFATSLASFTAVVCPVSLIHINLTVEKYWFCVYLGVDTIASTAASRSIQKYRCLRSFHHELR